VYGVVPPPAVTVAVPLLFPHVVEVEEVVKVMATASVMVTDAVAVQLLLSVIVTV
jgi:hypothetical protein